jgi:hypothetical protein
VTRIFLTLAIVTNAAVAVAVWYGLSIGDPSENLDAARHAMSMHLLVALGASLLVLMLHAVVLTYFMGTGRWLEDTSAAYKLDASLRQRASGLKYRTVLALVACMVLVIVTGAAGAMADPLSKATASLASTIHFSLAMVTVLANLVVSWMEYAAIQKNGVVVAAAVAEVKRIRAERGLD